MKKIEELYLPGQIICDQYACGLAPNCPCGEPHWTKDCAGNCPHDQLKACLPVEDVAEKVKRDGVEYKIQPVETNYG